jgi:hypothetical protein
MISNPFFESSGIGVGLTSECLQRINTSVVKENLRVIIGILVQGDSLEEKRWIHQEK